MKYILFLLIVISNITILQANESIKIDIKASCSYPGNLLHVDFFKDASIKEEFTITISSNKLQLTKDAVQYNIDGYVDIPEDSYYLKNNNSIYHLNGVVENLNSNNINQFTSYVDNNSETFINIKEFHTLKSSKDLKFIQKINLEKNTQIDNLNNGTTTNILNVYFDESLFNKEFQRCEEQIDQSKKNLFLQFVLLIFLVSIMLYLLKRNFKKQ